MKFSLEKILKREEDKNSESHVNSNTNESGYNIKSKKGMSIPYLPTIILSVGLSTIVLFSSCSKSDKPENQLIQRAAEQYYESSGKINEQKSSEISSSMPNEFLTLYKEVYKMHKDMATRNEMEKVLLEVIAEGKNDIKSLFKHAYKQFERSETSYKNYFTTYLFSHLNLLEFYRPEEMETYNATDTLFTFEATFRKDGSFNVSKFKPTEVLTVGREKIINHYDHFYNIIVQQPFVPPEMAGLEPGYSMKLSQTRGIKSLLVYSLETEMKKKNL